MADFATAYVKTNALEGLGLSDAASDRGGMTYGGIARERMPGAQWEGWQLIDEVRAHGAFKPSASEEALLLQLHQEFFKRWFWDAIHAGDLPDQQIADKVYDATVNCGAAGVEWLQAALNVANRRGQLWADVRVDGRIGPATVAAVAAACASPERKWLVLQVIETQQEQRYFELARHDYTQEDNLLGWYKNRILFRFAPPRP